MSHFNVNPVDGTNVEIAAASSGNSARFLAFGASNAGASTRILTIFDGASTNRVVMALGPGDHIYLTEYLSGKSVFPKSWWTAGNTIECDLDAAGDVRIFGELVREP